MEKNHIYHNISIVLRYIQTPEIGEMLHSVLILNVNRAILVYRNTTILLHKGAISAGKSMIQFLTSDTHHQEVIGEL
jgi:hypothetical protein